MEKPKCAVSGMIHRGAMCGEVIVGGVYCGHDGDCEHKIEHKKPGCDCTDIAAKQRHQSGDWLRQHGYGRMDGTPLMPEGELPA